MKSKTLFPRRASRSGTKNNSAAGNSTATYSAPDNDGYKDGMLGWRGSRRAGGMAGDDMISDRPKLNNRGMSGSGGLAWDSSMSPYMGTKGKAQP